MVLKGPSNQAYTACYPVHLIKGPFNDDTNNRTGSFNYLAKETDDTLWSLRGKSYATTQKSEVNNLDL